MVSFREFVNTEEYNIDMLRMTKKTRKRKRSIGLNISRKDFMLNLMFIRKMN